MFYVCFIPDLHVLYVVLYLVLYVILYVFVLGLLLCFGSCFVPCFVACFQSPFSGTDSRRRQFFQNRYTRECFAVSRHLMPVKKAAHKAKESRPPLRRTQQGSPARFTLISKSQGRKFSPERRAKIYAINKLLRKRQQQQMREHMASAGAV